MHLYTNIKAKPQRNQGVGIFTQREGLMQMGRYHFHILWTLPFQFLKDIFDRTTRSPVKTLNKSTDLMGTLSQEIPCRYHIDEDSIVSMASNQRAFSFATLIKLYYNA